MQQHMTHMRYAIRSEVTTLLLMLPVQTASLSYQQLADQGALAAFQLEAMTATDRAGRCCSLPQISMSVLHSPSHCRRAATAILPQATASGLKFARQNSWHCPLAVLHSDLQSHRAFAAHKPVLEGARR